MKSQLNLWKAPDAIIDQANRIKYLNLNRYQPQRGTRQQIVSARRPMIATDGGDII